MNGGISLVMKRFVLPAHSSVKMSFKLMKIDSWDNEAFIVYADDKELAKRVYGLD